MFPEALSFEAEHGLWCLTNRHHRKLDRERWGRMHIAITKTLDGMRSMLCARHYVQDADYEDVRSHLSESIVNDSHPSSPDFPISLTEGSFQFYFKFALSTARRERNKSLGASSPNQTAVETHADPAVAFAAEVEAKHAEWHWLLSVFEKVWGWNGEEFEAYIEHCFPRTSNDSHKYEAIAPARRKLVDAVKHWDPKPKPPEAGEVLDRFLRGEPADDYAAELQTSPSTVSRRLEKAGEIVDEILRTTLAMSPGAEPRAEAKLVEEFRASLVQWHKRARYLVRRNDPESAEPAKPKHGDQVRWRKFMNDAKDRFECDAVVSELIHSAPRESFAEMRLRFPHEELAIEGLKKVSSFALARANELTYSRDTDSERELSY